MKTSNSLASVCGKSLLLACLVATWALSLPASAQDDRTGGDAGAAGDSFSKSLHQVEAGAVEKGPEGPRVPERLSAMFIAGGPFMWAIAFSPGTLVALPFQRLLGLRPRRRATP